MPVEIQFSDDKRYILYTLTDPLDMNKLQAAYEQEKEFRDSVDYTVHSIVDMRGIKGIPRNWLNAKSGPGLTHPHSGKMLFVGVSQALKTIVTLILQIMRYKRMEFFDTLEDAQAQMQELLKEEVVE